MSSLWANRGGSAMSYMWNIPRGLTFFRQNSNMASPPEQMEQRPSGLLTRIVSNGSKVPGKDLSAYPGVATRLDQVNDRKRPTGRREFSIQPSGAEDTFVYEPSLSSKSSTIFSDGDAASVRSLPVGRTSQESLLYDDDDDGSDVESVDSETTRRDPRQVVPVNLPSLIAQSNHAGIITVPLPPASDSDSEGTAQGDYEPGPSSGVLQHYTPSAPTSIPSASRRIPSQQQASASYPPTVQYRSQEAPQTSRSAPERRGSIQEDARTFPPGLSTTPRPTYITPNVDMSSSYPPSRRERRESFSVPPPVGQNVSASPPRLSVTTPSPRVPMTPSPPRAPTTPSPRGPSSVASSSQSASPRTSTAPPVLQVRNADPRMESPASEVVSVSVGAGSGSGSFASQASSSSRVRWNENLICPSPVPKDARRRGWFNRRGDQLWTNQGAFKPAPAGEEYPRDLHQYPDFGVGWMNEEGVRIDMLHRLVPKAPLRSALKRFPTANTV